MAGHVTGEPSYLDIVATPDEAKVFRIAAVHGQYHCHIPDCFKITVCSLQICLQFEALPGLHQVGTLHKLLERWGLGTDVWAP